MGTKRTGLFGTLKWALSDFGDDDALSYAAAVAFYAALSLAPMVLLFLWVTGLMGERTQQEMIREIERVTGPSAGDAIREIVRAANDRPDTSTLAGAIGIITVVVSATGVFAQLQQALNVIWDVKAKPVGREADLRGWRWAVSMGWGMVRKRLLSLGMIVTLGFLLLVSMAVSAALSAIMGGGGAGGASPEHQTAAWWEIANAVVSVGVFTLLFAVMFRYLPDVRIPWRAVWGGAVVTAVLFVVGRYLVGLYLGRGTVGSGYGAAGSLVAMLVWVYYASVIVFVGAEITQAWAAARGVEVVPEEHAERVKRDPKGTGHAVETAHHAG